MDILMIIHRPYPPSPRLRREAKTLTEAGHDVRVLHPASESGTEVADGIKVRRYTETSNITKKLSSNLLKIDLDLKREIEKEADIGFDVVHVHDFPPAPTVLHAVDCPVILDMHDNYPELVREWELEPTWSIWGRVWGRVIRKFPRDPKRAIYNTFRLPYRYKRDVRNLRKAAERSDTVLAVVPEAKEAYMEMGVEEEKITVISNTVDLDWFEKYSVEDPSLETDEILITFTGKSGF
ncbi:MAG: glycosyltransferase [Halobacteriales archaeon]|nr:glycosyltransferase [Halobacteriales archaeon]